jgi:hypothetical protein
VRAISTAVCLALCSSSALAAEFGIGISAKSDDGWIYAPIEINDKYRIEPSVRYQTNEFSTAQVVGNTVSESRTQETETLEFGVGVFRLMKIAESAQLYFGARVAYVDTEGSAQNTFASFPGSNITTRSESSQDGYRIGPAIGFEYLFGERFSIGGEASYSFLDLEGESVASTVGSSSSSRVDIDQQTSGTDTWLILRYRF